MHTRHKKESNSLDSFFLCTYGLSLRKIYNLSLIYGNYIRYQKWNVHGLQQ